MSAMHQFAAWVLWPLLLALNASAQLQCPTGLPGGSKYMLCLAGSSTPPAQPDPYPVRLGQPGVDFFQNYAGISGATAVRLFRSVDVLLCGVCNGETCMQLCPVQYQYPTQMSMVSAAVACVPCCAWSVASIHSVLSKDRWANHDQ